MSHERKGRPLIERWARDREIFSYKTVTQPDGSVKELRESIPINGWEQTPDGKWINPDLGITKPID